MLIEVETYIHVQKCTYTCEGMFTHAAAAILQVDECGRPVGLFTVQGAAVHVAHAVTA